MRAIVIQKLYLFLVETSENIYEAFLVIVNFIFYISEKLTEAAVEIVEEVKSKLTDLYRYIFGFRGVKLEAIRVVTKTNHPILPFRNNDFLIFSNLLAPPYLK
jgi:hypothetical protein